MTNLPQTIVEAAGWLRRGRITSAGLTDALLTRCYSTQNSIAAFITLCETSAKAAADQADLQLAQGIDLGPLHGIPLVIKDNLATADAPTTANSKVLDPAWAERADATVVRKLREAGAVILGKTGLYEFALGQPDPALGFPIPKNPWNLSRIPGGSSSGTAAAITAGLALGGLGTDTGGSIRVPAAYCGISGLRPTFGRVSKEGCVPLAYSLDTVGPLARTVHDCALILQAIAGCDPGDPNTVNTAVPDMTAGLPALLDNVRLGLPHDYFFTAPELNPEVKAAVLTAVDEMAAAGAKILDLHLPHLAEAYAAWWTITFAEAYAYHEPDLRRRPELYGPATRQSILTGSLLTAADYLQAQRLRSLVQIECAAALAEVDAVIVPCTISTAPLAEDWDHFTTPSFTSLWSLLGYPALGLGCGFSSEGLPIGMQIVGKPFAESKLLAVGNAYQQITAWHNQRPQVAQENY
jgi:aspartyl-tRNA(Asn)/glutamyl-tRNA(Gln) amidotransferase subunit A